MIAAGVEMYAEGLGVPRNVRKAITLYEQASNNEVDAAVALARIYSKGIDVSADRNLARKWYSVAASFEGKILGCEELEEARAYLRDNAEGSERQ